MSGHDEIRELASRLLAGEVIDRVDEHGRHWQGTADRLSLVQPGTGAVAPVLLADAYTVAARLVATRGCDVAVGSSPSSEVAARSDQ